MPSQYGHTIQGINLTNYRLLLNQTAKKTEGTYRTPAEWYQETRDHVGMTSSEQKLSSTLRHTSSLLQTQAADLVVHDLNTVEAALRQKIAQTDTLKIQLERALTDVDSEIAALHVVRGNLEVRLSKVESKSELNNNRLQVRSSRPSRELTMDDVERSLLVQQQLIQTFTEKVKRAVSHVDRELGHLEGVKTKLLADLRDKMDAIEVDTAVMGVGPQGETGGLPTLNRRAHDGPAKTPHTWVRSTEENLTLARHWLADSARLRKAIRHAMTTARTLEHDAARTLNVAMLAKLNSTEHLKENINAQLAKVHDETVKASAQRNKLAAALEAKRGPLLQAKERFALRKARPARETVNDDVEAALTREIAHLNAVTSQLSDKVASVDKELDALALASAMLQDNLRDKEAALSLDQRCVLLDGRINLQTPPPSSIASAPMSAASSARSATLRRIADLETELQTARMEREKLEANVYSLRQSLQFDKLPSPTSALQTGSQFSPVGLQRPYTAGPGALASNTLLSPAATRSF